MQQLGVVNSSHYNDVLDRPTQAITANNISNSKSQSTIIYDDANRKVTLTADLFSFGDNLAKTESFYDGLSRDIEKRHYKDGGYMVTRTVYDALGRVEKVSNPYRPLLNEGEHWTTTEYNALGQIVKAKTADNAEVVMSYLGNAIIETDQAGMRRRSIVNAVKQLVRVDEPNAAGQLDVNGVPVQPTNYSYDVSNNLMTVTQGGQTRTFIYDSLSRLKQATSPEMGSTPTNGTILYQYDNNGNLTQKTDARGVQTISSYDSLNRVLTRNYTGPPNLPNYQATPDVTYTYDDVTISNSKGSLTRVGSSVSQTEYTAFDALGRVLSYRQTTDGISYMTGYLYNLSGALIEEVYPSGRVVKNVLDNDGDLSLVQSKKTTNHGFHTYANSFTYTAAGAVSSMQLGNGRWESMQFNSRLQLTQVALGTVQNGTDKLKLNYSYGTWESGTINSQKNNGNLAQQTITVPTVGQTQGFTAVQNYSYDSLNRLKDATETMSGNQTWKQTFVYDLFGNRRFDPLNTTTIPQGCSVAVCNPEVNVTNNRLTGYQFDNAGNITADAQNRSFTYDGENRQIDVKNSANQTVGQFWYDGDGRRVKKYVPSTTETTVFVYDAQGKMVAEYSTIVSQPTEAKVSYLTNDRLGSPRILTDADGNTISRRDFMPFGEEIFTTQRVPELGYTPDTIRKKFTGYERDNEIDLDYAQARYHNYKLGRFQSPDPILIRKERLADPQTINLYVYVRNNPLNYTDPDGRTIVDEEGNEIRIVEVDGWILVACSKCKSDSKQLADTIKLARMINSARYSGNSQARNQLIALSESKTKVHIVINTDPATTRPDLLGSHRPHSSTANGNVPLDWDRFSGYFQGTPDVVGNQQGEQYYREASIILYQLTFDPDGTMAALDLYSGMLGTFVHEAEHDLDPQQIWNAYAGVRSPGNAPAYHPSSLLMKERRAENETRNSGLSRMQEYLIFEYLYYNGGCYLPPEFW